MMMMGLRVVWSETGEHVGYSDICGMYYSMEYGIDRANVGSR